MRRLDPRAPLFALALLAIVEWVARSDALWRRVPDSMVGAFTGIEEVVLSRAPVPEVVFVGSSRMRDAVDPRRLEAALELPRGGVLNLGLTGGTPFEALLFYERHRALLGRARVLVVGVEDWYWNAGFPPDEVERLHATFADRWRWFQRRGKLDDLAGGAWRTLEAQDTLLRFGVSLVRGVEPLRFVEDRLVWRTPNQILEVGPATVDLAPTLEHLMQSYAAGPAYEPELDRLLEMARADGLTVVITQAPLRDAYVDLVHERVPGAQPLLRERVAAIAAAHHARVELFERASDLGLPDDRFYDYGHVTEDGCRRLVPIWARVADAARRAN